jgi:GH15 family glucan-1,4-alpha-glucosidase
MSVDIAVASDCVMGEEAYAPIEDYGVIGDLHTVALVGRDGSIDLLSYPNFDSPTVFAALLDRRRGGRFALGPCLEGGVRKQLYLPDTNVLLTRTLHTSGVAEVSDFMPVADTHGHGHTIVRRAKCVRGEVTFDVVCHPRFDYGRAEHSVQASPNEVVFASRGPDETAMRLRTEVPCDVREGAATARFTLQAGQTAAFVLEPAAATPSTTALCERVSRSFVETVNYWRTWVGHSQYEGRWREMVHRSALVLKLLVSDRHGSLVAAPTFGLPERVGGERNWDYRYTWIRDASFTLYGLMRLGYTAEAGRFMRWIIERIEQADGERPLQVLYRHDGQALPTEETLGHLDGHRGSRPVRVGNGAAHQLQLDIYGELMDAVYLSNKYGESISHDLWQRLIRIIDWVCEHWQLPDAGIWEVRGPAREFLYSRLLSWVALDRGIRLAERRSFPYPSTRWRQARDAIYHEIHQHFWDPNREAFVQAKGSRALDASALLLPMLKFLSPTDPRFISTLRAIEADLVEDSLVFRYRIGQAAPDGLDGGEGTFTACSFWYAEALARTGDVQKARFVFEKTLGYANHLGLYAEELGAHGEHLGNYPQAFTHLALISAAFAIDRKLSDAGWIA